MFALVPGDAGYGGLANRETGSPSRPPSTFGEALMDTRTHLISSEISVSRDRHCKRRFHFSQRASHSRK